MPVHSVELGHFILFNVELQDTGDFSQHFFVQILETLH